MKKVILSALVAGLFVGTSCSKDDDSNNGNNNNNNNGGNTANGVEGKWKYDEYDYDGVTTQDMGDGTTMTTYISSEMSGGNAVLEFKTNPNIVVPEGNMILMTHITMIYENDTITQSLPQQADFLADESEYEILGNGKMRIGSGADELMVDYVISGNIMTLTGSVSLTQGPMETQGNYELKLSRL